MSGESIIGLCEELMRMGLELEASRIAQESKPCNLCKPNDPCWWHLPFVNRVKPDLRSAA